MARAADTHPYVSRGGLKLAHALDEFAIDVAGLRCADFGCNVGGFTDCLLQRGAAHVTAVDTGYGTLAWKLRSDERVTTLERTNALHADPPDEPVDLVVIDMGWTVQRLCVPAALAWLGAGGRIVTLIKPHYEAKEQGAESLLAGGVLSENDAQRVCEACAASLPALGVGVLGVTRSPVLGGASRGKKKGNVEYLALLETTAPVG